MATTLKKLVTPPFRLSFPHLFEKNSFKGSKPKYSCVMIFDVDKFSPKEKAQYVAMIALANEKSLEFHKKALKDYPSTWNKPMRNGKDKADLEGYGPGKMFGTASTEQQPGIIDKNKQPILDAEEVYPGCWCRATITAYSYDVVSKGTAFGLQNLQKLGEGKSFTGRIDADQDFDDDAEDVWKESDVAPDIGEDDDLLS